MTYIERAQERQRAEEAALKAFREDLSRALLEKARKVEQDRCNAMWDNQVKQYAGQENCCPYGGNE